MTDRLRTHCETCSERESCSDCKEQLDKLQHIMRDYKLMLIAIGIAFSVAEGTTLYLVQDLGISFVLATIEFSIAITASEYLRHHVKLRMLELAYK